MSTTTVEEASTEVNPTSKTEGDEEIAGMSLATSIEDEGRNVDVDVTSVELLDPAIVLRGNVVKPPRFMYSRERLIEISDLPLSKVKPEFLDPSNNDNRGILVLNCIPNNLKRTETPNEENSRKETTPDVHAKQRRSGGDPRERIRKEQDGIVLSPQRRSFNLGCSAPLVAPSSSRVGRPESPLGKPDLVHRTEMTSRRIGSGRIVTRDVSWDGMESQEYTFRSNSGAQIVRERRIEPERDDRFERRSFGRDFDRDKDRHPPTRNGSRFGGNNDRRRAFSDSKDEEPEWFSGGPKSQADTIELRGFDDIPEERNGTRKIKTTNTTQKKKITITKEANNNLNSSKEITRETQVKITIDNQAQAKREASPPLKGPGGRSTPTHQLADKETKKSDNKSPKKDSESERDKNTEGGSNKTDLLGNSECVVDENEFIFDDFLKMDTIANLLPNGTNTEDVGGSRFSRWFTRESPVKQSESRRSSMQEEIINNMIKDLTEPCVSIPSVSESDTYFAPISPAANNTGSQLGGNQSGPIGPPSSQSNNKSNEKSLSFLELLQRGNKQQQQKQQAQQEAASAKKLDVPGKVLSLEELEANIRRSDKMANQIPASQKPEEELTAFKRLMAQVSGGHVVPATNGPMKHSQPPMSLLQMLNKSQQEDNSVRNSSHPQNHPPHIPPELVMKLHHVQQHQANQRQQEMMNKLMQANVGSAGRPYQASPLPQDMLNAANQNTYGLELLQRPEAEAIIQGLKRGEITSQHLLTQLANPAIQPRHRDMLLYVLKMINANLPPQMQLSPRAVSPGNQHNDLFQQLMFHQQQQQQLRVSPLPNAAYCVSPILATSPNTLTVHHPAMPPRIPSPRELQAHTQSIMQQALIKKKLEEQRENYRKKQESLQQRSMSPAMGNMTSPAKHLSPTPHAFTPTSVLRKMTASKENEQNMNLSSSKEKQSANNIPNNPLSEQSLSKQQSVNLQRQQGRPITGIRQAMPTQQPLPQPQPPQQAPQQMPMSWNTQPSAIKQGRPILKGNNYPSYPSGGVDFNIRNIQHIQQQQQQQSSNISGALNSVFAQLQQEQQRAKMNPTIIGSGGAGAGVAPSNLVGNFLAGGMPHRSQSSSNIPNSATRPQQLQLQMSQMQRNNVNPAIRQLLQMQGQGYENRGIPITGRNNNMQFNRGSPLADNIPGDLSPTSNQLARWFSPELLAKARAGKLPDMPPVSVAQNARNLEELERIQQAAAAVHN